MTRALRTLVWPIGVLALYYVALRLVPVRATADVSRGAAGECWQLLAQDANSPHSADVAWLETCAAADPYDAELMRELGSAYEARQEWTRAESWYRRALVLDADDGDVHTRLGRLLLRRHDVEGARAQAASALKTQPGGPAAMLLARAAAADQPSGAETRGGR